MLHHQEIKHSNIVPQSLKENVEQYINTQVHLISDRSGQQIVILTTMMVAKVRERLAVSKQSKETTQG
jgi:hypothetical protein